MVRASPVTPAASSATAATAHSSDPRPTIVGMSDCRGGSGGGFTTSASVARDPRSAPVIERLFRVAERGSVVGTGLLAAATDRAPADGVAAPPS